jgi:hypothetical protein
LCNRCVASYTAISSPQYQARGQALNTNINPVPVAKLIVFAFLSNVIRFSSDFLSQQQNTPEGNSFFQFIGFGSLLNWRIPELGVYWHFSLIIFPLLTVITSADQTCSVAGLENLKKNESGKAILNTR